MSRYGSVKQRGRHIAICPKCKEKVWTADKSVITQANPLVIEHLTCPRSRRT